MCLYMDVFYLLMAHTPVLFLVLCSSTRDDKTWLVRTFLVDQYVMGNFHSLFPILLSTFILKYIEKF